ncbi:hypothetical protein [Paraclostridium sp. AKS73]|nr:hypothetical protein [Paraclostridium sp. AKS73]
MKYTLPITGGIPRVKVLPKFVILSWSLNNSVFIISIDFFEFS